MVRRLRCFLASPQKHNLTAENKKFLVGNHRRCLLSYQPTNSQITNLLLFPNTYALQCKRVFSLIRILQKALKLLAFVCTAWEFSFKVFTLFLKIPIFVSNIVRPSPQPSVMASHFSSMEKVREICREILKVSINEMTLNDQQFYSLLWYQKCKKERSRDAFITSSLFLRCEMRKFTGKIHSCSFSGTSDNRCCGN